MIFQAAGFAVVKIHKNYNIRTRLLGLKKEGPHTNPPHQKQEKT